MIDEEIRELILENITEKELDTNKIIDILSTVGKKDILFQLLLLEKSKLVSRKVLEHQDPLMNSTWKASPQWKELIEKEKSSIVQQQVQEKKDISKPSTQLVATIPPEFGDFKKSEIMLETRDALYLLFSSVEKELLISSPYLDEILRLYLPFLKENPNKDLSIKLMTITQDREIMQQRLQRIIDDLKTKFPASEVIMFESSPKFTNSGISRIFKTHAKIIIVDDKYLFVTSANLMRTSYLDNFEMGFLTSEKHLIEEAKQLYFYLIKKVKLMNE